MVSGKIGDRPRFSVIRCPVKTVVCPPFLRPISPAEDARFDYGEPRFTTVGVLDGRMVILVWTPRGEVRRIISMRKANEREIEKFAQALG